MQRSGSAAKPARPHSRTGRTYILYAVLDFIVDNYKPVLETIHGEVEAIEDRVLSAELIQTEVERLYLLRRDLLRLRNAVVPLVEVCRKLEHSEVIAIDPTMRPLFRDVTDHIRRVQEEIDALREVLAFVRGQSAHGASPANRGHAQARGLGRHSGGADRDRGHLRHELQIHS